MASHRKPRPRTLSAAGPRAALGITSAALATVTLLSENASAAPVSSGTAASAGAHPTIAQVQAQVAQLDHQAEVASQQYDAAQEKVQGGQKALDGLLDQMARNAQQLNASRRQIGRLAAAQYRTAGLGDTATFLLATSPQQYFDQLHIMKRASGQAQQLVTDYQTQAAQAAKQRSQASQSLRDLTAAQQQLAADKAAVQQKLAAAQQLLNSLTAQQKAGLAAEQQRKDAAAARQAALAAPAVQTGAGASAANLTAGAKAVAFARAQLDKPYVWGATGPDSYDCSGLTQAAWAAAGVSLPRTTWEQVKVGTPVSVSQLEPGDLVFFYSDISHVGIYIGGGMMIHAPHTGTVVKIAPISEMPIYGAVRP